MNVTVLHGGKIKIRLYVGGDSKGVYEVELYHTVFDDSGVVEELGMMAFQRRYFR